MPKVILLLFVAMLIAFQPIHAQRSFSVTITLDTAIDAGQVRCNYNNGKEIIYVPDTFVNRRLVLKDELYAEYATVSVTYDKDVSYGHSPDFFIGDTAAVIRYGFKNDAFVYKSYQHAIPINDTATNIVWRELLAARMKEAVGLSTLWTKYTGNEIMSNDSLRHLNDAFQKSMQGEELAVLKKHSHDYYSFWFFKDQIITPSLMLLGNDTIYLHHLLTFLKTAFPPKFTQSVEGRELTQKMEGLIRRPDKGTSAPFFSFIDMNGHDHQLSDFKGKYVLLDFWATWCGPCMQAVPFMKELRAKYPTDKLVMIGLNYDHDVTKFRKVVAENKMNWIHCFDKDKDVERLFGEDALPTVILIDKEGMVVYRYTGIGDEEGMRKVMEQVE